MRFTSKTKRALLNFLLVFGLAFFLFLLLNLQTLAGWHLSGDDLYSLSFRIKNLGGLVSSLANFSGQYRPLTYLLFNFYHFLMPQVKFIFLVHGSLLSLVVALLYLVILPNKKISFINQLAYGLLAFSLFLTPIFYYHIYTISSLANLLILIITLLELIYLKHTESLRGLKSQLLFFALTVLAVFIKETFFIPLVVFILASLKVKTAKTEKRTYSFIFFASLIFLAYLVLRLSFYQVTDTNYAYVFSLAKLKENSLNILAWLVNYPRGWAYGAPERFGLKQDLISLGQLLLLGIGLVAAFFWNKKDTLKYIFLFLVSLAPFLFLNRTLVYYLDLAFIFLILLLSLAVNYFFLSLKQKFLTWGFVLAWFLLLASNLWLIRPQWLNYSFVARANQAVTSYLSYFNQTDIKSVCILSHQRGEWGTEAGLAVKHYFPKRQIQVVSIKNDRPSQACLRSDLILINDAWSYLKK